MIWRDLADVAKVILASSNSNFDQLAAALHLSPPTTYQTTDSYMSVCCLALRRFMVVSRLDYCNTVLGGMSRRLLDRLQCVFGAAASHSRQDMTHESWTFNHKWTTQVVHIGGPHTLCVLM